MIAIIDLDSLAYSAGCDKKIYSNITNDFLKDENGKFLYESKSNEEIYDSVDLLMNSILTSTKCSKYIAYIKGKNTSKFRYAIKSDYKANRPKERPLWWDVVYNYFIKKWNAIVVDDIEVDDAVNITKNYYKENSFIVAIDKDLLNLEGIHFNWRKLEWVKVSSEEALYYFWSDMLTGQSGDNIKGVPKIGTVSAKKILKDSYNYTSTVLEEYIKYFGQYNGIEEFYKNYKCLKILDTYDNFSIPNYIEINNNE